MQAIVQETSEVPVVEWIQEQIVETIEVIPQERVKQRTAKQIVHVPGAECRHRFGEPANFCHCC